MTLTIFSGRLPVKIFNTKGERGKRKAEGGKRKKEGGRRKEERGKRKEEALKKLLIVPKRGFVF